MENIFEFADEQRRARSAYRKTALLCLTAELSDYIEYDNETGSAEELL